MADPSDHTVDVIIVGTGPAGLSTALHLLQINPDWGRRMLLLEKEAHPRHKLCGGGVTRLGIEVLTDLGLPFPIPIPHVQVEDVRMVYQSQTIHVRGKPQFTVFHRAELDAYLAQAVKQRGGIIHQNEPANEVWLDAGGATVVTPHDRYRARIVVGADGSKGRLRKLVNSPGGNNRVARTLEVLAPASEAAQTFTGRYAIFNFSHAHHRLNGYLWDFPSRKKGLPFNNRGIYDTGLFVNKKRRSLPQLLTAFLSSLGSNPESVSWQGHPIHLFDPGRRLSVPGLMLVGDAAGIDPALGEGIGPSLAYGQVAAQTIQDAFQRGDFSLRAYHRRVLQSRVGQYLSFRWFVAETVYRFAGLPGFMSLFWAFAYLVNRLAPEPPPLYSD